MIFLLKTKFPSSIYYQPVSVLVFSIVVYLSGISFMGVGGVSTLMCQRQEMRSRIQESPNTCMLANTSFLAPNRQEIALVDLQQATLNRQLRNYHAAYRVVLLTQREKIPLTSFSPSDRETKVAMVDEINRFLQNPDQQKLQLELEDSRYSSVFGFLLIVTGIGSRLFARQIINCLSTIRHEAQSDN